MDFTIIVPSIRHEILPRFVDSIPDAVGSHRWHLIVVSPSFSVQTRDILSVYAPYNDEVSPEGCLGVTLIEDKGSPSRCLQRAVDKYVRTPIFCWLTDDAVLFPSILGECVDIVKHKPNKDGLAIKYTENGPGTFTGALDEYYISNNHEANRQPGIPPHFKIAPVGMFWTDYWKYMGGIDSVNFDHINMNAHDFAYRLQHDGGEIHYSPGVVMHCDSSNWGEDHAVLDASYIDKDLPNFISLYKDDSRKNARIDLSNWKKSEEIWRRFL